MFTPEDFQKLSIELKTNQKHFDCGERALSRTSISRLYYYLFLRCREIIISKLNEQNKILFTNEECSKKHHYIIQIFLYRLAKRITDTKIGLLAETLRELREERNRADYDLELDITFENFNVLIEDKEDIEDYISRLIEIEKNKFNQVFERIKDKCQSGF
ncbi:hypothetical protein [Persephonella sp.]